MRAFAHELRLVRTRWSRSAVLVLTLAASSISTSAPPPLGPGGSELSPWRPIHQRVRHNGEEGCGSWSWEVNPAYMTTPFIPLTSVPFTPSLPTTAGSFQLGMPVGESALEGRYTLTNSIWFLTGSTGDAPEAFGMAERNGFLRWFPDYAAGVPLTASPTRLRLTSIGELHGSIDLDFGVVLAGEVTRIASGGLKAAMKTIGDFLGPRIDLELAGSPSMVKVSPNAIHASESQQSGLGLGFTIGADNGASGEVQWQAGGTQAVIEMTEHMKVVQFDCVAPSASDGFTEWYFSQQVDVFVDAALIHGRHSIVNAKATFLDFKFDTMGCPSCGNVGSRNPGQIGS